MQRALALLLLLQAQDAANFSGSGGREYIKFAKGKMIKEAVKLCNSAHSHWLPST